MTKAKLVIMRHGQTTHNLQHLISGQMDVPLTPRGEDQAREAGRLVAHIRFDIVYSSHLSRAFNTAALALEAAGQKLPVERRREVAEIDTGDLTGRDFMRDNGVQALNDERDFDMPIPGGESDRQFFDRVRKFYDAEVLPRLRRGENVLIVAHGGVVSIFGLVLGVEPMPAKGKMLSTRNPPNAAPVVYEFSNGVLVTGRSPGGKRKPRPRQGPRA